MYCRNCGKKLADDARFCPECGARVAKVGDILTNRAEKKAEAPVHQEFVDFDTEKAPDEKRIYDFKWNTEDFHREPKRPAVKKEIEWGDLLGVKATRKRPQSL